MRRMMAKERSEVKIGGTSLARVGLSQYRNAVATGRVSNHGPHGVTTTRRYRVTVLTDVPLW